MSTTFTPTCTDEDEGLPAPFGKLSQIIESEKSHEEQRFEAKKMLDFIKSEDIDHYSSLLNTSTPTPLLIKVPGTHTVRFITGLAPYINDPFSSHRSQLADHFLAIMQDIDIIDEDVTTIRLPKDILKLNAIMSPTETQFITKLELNEDTPTGTSWFQQNPVKENTYDLAKVAPLPPYLAYDAFTEDVPAHLIWERIQMADQENMEDVFTYTKNFLMTAHVNHNITNNKNLQIDSQYFMERQNNEAKQWGQKRASTIYPTIAASKAKTTSSSADTISEFTKILGVHKPTDSADRSSTTTAPTDAADVLYKRFGMSTNDLNRTLQMCGLSPGQEDQLPSWFSEIAEKNLSTDGKRNIIKILFRGNTPYEEHEIPGTPTILDLAIKRTWISDGDGATATGVMKGLSPYLFAAITAEEVEHETNFADAVRNSGASTVSDLQKLKHKKATSPASHQTLVATLKTFANTLERLFSGRGPLYMVLRANIITPLTKLNNLAKSLMKKTTLASIMWGCYKQAQHYAMGQMKGPTALIAEWQIMTQNILGGAQDFKFLEVPLTIAGTETEMKPQTPITPKIKANDTPTNTNGAPNQEPASPPKRRKIKIEIHPTIKAKITAILPNKLNMRKLTTACNIQSARNIFPDSDICVPTALTGICPYTTCRNSHDPEKITDEMAEAAISVLDPIIRNPLSLNQGQ